MCPASNWPLRIVNGGPKPWAPLAYASHGALARYPLTLQTFLITVILVLPLNASPYYVWWFYLQESWADGPTTKTHYLAQADCQPAGCQSAIKFEFPQSKSNTIRSSKDAFALCFLYQQTQDRCRLWNQTYGGCPYANCVIHKPFHTEGAPPSDMLLLDNQGKVSLIIHDPWNIHWEKGTTGKIYFWFQNSHPSGTWLIYRVYTRTLPIEIDRLNSLSNTIRQNEATLTDQIEPSSNTPQPFSWITLVQQGANMLSLTEADNFTDCFLCASLNQPPLAAVPLRTGFNLSRTPTGPDTTLTGIPLFKIHSHSLSLYVME
ncbi:putative endogenous retrovirus group FC1 Env polyprotein [Aotus nancymaae]|uniref:putative endogenous retrovirus group FC1 Env polyprotein n=1 Tax=Aotus nancymaae TaxID=37293 RepID=UPI0030FF06E9